ncbi:hypothetical protein K474DRAFT_1736289 [Panus rudis PR-1116 ss-1]|nr:hypothetical protein K474DRAFT_1736289 [Panus rudis PR-1116 ss-1]
MSHSSPATYLAWSILSTMLGCFLLFHLWNFDRFRCLKWNHGPHSGAFKRIMTYTYITSIPCIVVYAIGFAVIKYQAGYSFIPGFGIIPTPWQLWPESHKRVIFPLQLIFSFAWSLEMVTHLEELCFWLFLIYAGSVQRDWFRSLYFKTWIVGSFVALIYMPLVAIFTRSDPIRCEAFTFLAGSLGDLTLTIWFTPILFAFPRFLDDLRRENVDMNTIVRLTTFYELNSIRVVFRFLFTVPLLVLAVDGVRPHQHINTSNFWTELLSILGGIGCVVSSGITLVIFFPRSIQTEIEVKQASRQLRSQPLQRPFDTGFFNDTPQQEAHSMYGLRMGSPTSAKADPESADATKTVVTFAPNRRLSTGDTVEGAITVVNLQEDSTPRQGYRSGSIHPFIHNFTSPIGT